MTVVGEPGGSVVVRLTADEKALLAGLARGGAAVQGFGDAVTRQNSRLASMSATLTSIGGGLVSFGAKMTRSVTLPLAAAAGGAMKLAYDFEETMTKIGALVGYGEKDLARFRTQITGLSKDTGKSSKDIAEAYYFILSSGLQGKKAFDALTASTKASAAGMGEIATIADAVTSALNAYGTSNLSAAKATDILLAAVREGKAEPEQFAAAIGAVIPVAQVMGVSFGEVAGMMAALSLNGTQASEAVTQITAALSEAIKPSKQGADALKSIGMSYADLRREIDQRGLQATFAALKEKFHGNNEELAKVFGNIRSLRGALTLTGASAKKYKDIIAEVERAHGDVNQTLEATAETTGFKLRTAWNELMLVGMDIGVKLLPILERVLSKIADAVGWFSKLSETKQNLILWAAAVAAAVGPLATIFGNLAKGVGGAVGLLGKLGKGAAAVSGGGALTGGKGIAGRSALAFFGGPVALAAVGAAIAAGITTALHKKYGKEHKPSAPARDMGRSGSGTTTMAGRYQTVQSIHKIVADLQVKGATASAKEFKQIMALHSAMSELLRKPILLGKIETAKTQGDMVTLRDMMMTELGITKAQANEVMQQFFADFDPKPPVKRGMDEVEKTITVAGPKLAVLGSRSGEDITKGLKEGTKGASGAAKLWTVSVVKGLHAGDKIIYGAGAKHGKQASGGLQSTVDSAERAGSSLADRAATAIEKASNKAEKAGTTVGNASAAGMRVGANAAGRAGSTSGGKYAGGVRSKEGQASAAGQLLAKAATPPVGNWFGIGASAGAGFARGVASAASAAAVAAAGLSGAAMAAARKMLDSRSPSREMEKIGKGAADGFALGIEKNSKRAVEATMRLALSVVAAMDKALGGVASKRAKRVKAAAELIGPVRELFNFVTDMREALRALSDSALPALSADAKRAVAGIVSISTALGSSIAAAFTRIYGQTWIKAQKDKKGKVTKAGHWSKTRKQTRLEHAAETSGPVGELVRFAVEMIDALEALNREALPTLSETGRAAAVALAGTVAALSQQISKAIAAVFPKGGQEAGVLGGSAEAAGSMASIMDSMLGWLHGFAELTEEVIQRAIIGIGLIAERAPGIGAAVRGMVLSLQESLKGIAIDDAFVALTASVRDIIGSVSETLGSLFGLTPGEAREGERQLTLADVVEGAIKAAAMLGERAADLGGALQGMLTNLGAALSGIGADSLDELKALLASIAEVAGATRQTIESLAGIEAGQISAAQQAGEQLGKGFYDGLRSWHGEIVSEAESVNRDVISALAGEGASGAAGRMAVAVREAIDQAVASALAAVAREVAAT